MLTDTLGDYLGGNITSLASECNVNVTNSTHSIFLTGVANKECYVKILSELTYANTEDEPGNTTREVVFTQTTQLYSQAVLGI